jgi:hypothetical protein
MDIEDSFTIDAIERAGTNVGEDEETQLHTVINTLMATRSVPPTTEQIVDLSVLCFVAGRTYQNDQMAVTLRMTPRVLATFLEFLMEKGVSDE